MPWRVTLFSLISRMNTLHQEVAARCLSLVDARLDEMSDAPDETSEGSLRQLLKGATGYETQLTSSTLAPCSLSQVSLPSEEELGARSDLGPPWCLEYLEGDHERMLRGVDEHQRIARDARVELYTDPFLRCNQKRLDRFHMFRWTLHPQERVGFFTVTKKDSKIRMILDARRMNQRFSSRRVWPRLPPRTSRGLTSACLTE